MRHTIALLFFFLILLLDRMPCHAQKVNSLEIDNGRFIDLVTTIEKQLPLRFYYHEADVDSIVVSVSYAETDLDTLLDAVLTPFGLYYAIDFQGRVFITSGQKVLTELVAGSGSALAPEGQRTVDSNRAMLQSTLHEIGVKSSHNDFPLQLEGYVRDAGSNAGIPNVLISIVGTNITVSTDHSGFYRLHVPAAHADIQFSHAGKLSEMRRVLMHDRGALDVSMFETPSLIEEVIVSAKRTENLTRTELGVTSLDISQIRKVPVVFGEADVVKVILALPGVQTVGESASGFNVRGGATDQNLVLFEGSTIYNPSHFFGFFSAFNPDAVSEVELYKSSIPARLGGRLSSVLDVKGKTGNKEKISGEGGIGMLTSRLTLDGPIDNKTTFLVGGRSTYSDWLLGLIPDDQYKNSKASFYDVNLNVVHELDSGSSLQANGYFSRDNFLLADSLRNGYSNQHARVSWNKSFSPVLRGSVQAGVDHYRFNVSDEYNEAHAYRFDYNLTQAYVKAGAYHHVSQKHQLNYGVDMVNYRLQPGAKNPHANTSLIQPHQLSNEQALETSFFFSDKYSLTDQLVIDAGVRYSIFNLLGPTTIRNYQTGLPKSESTILSEVSKEAWQIAKTYHAPEIRFNVNYMLDNSSSLKLGFNTLQQYIHMLSSTTSISPTDIWKLSDSNIKPQQGGQVAGGYYKNWYRSGLEVSIEAYYKYINNYLDYKSGAVLLMNDAIEMDVIGTRAKSYGVEFQLKKVTGRVSGWVSYSYSRALQRAIGVEGDELINNGAYYPANFDKPHSFNFVGNFRLTHRFSFSLNADYSTGRPITVPIGRFYYAGSERVYYSDRNQYRIPDYFRMDASFNVEGSHKLKKLAHSSWSVGVYNVTGRKNPLSVFFVSENGQVNGYRFSVFGSQIPYITYNFRF